MIFVRHFVFLRLLSVYVPCLLTVCSSWSCVSCFLLRFLRLNGCIVFLVLLRYSCFCHVYASVSVSAFCVRSPHILSLFVCVFVFLYCSVSNARAIASVCISFARWRVLLRVVIRRLLNVCSLVDNDRGVFRMSSSSFLLPSSRNVSHV